MNTNIYIQNTYKDTKFQPYTFKKLPTFMFVFRLWIKNILPSFTFNYKISNNQNFYF